MKFTINTEKKVITLEESTNFSTFVKVVKKIVRDEWTEYTLERTVIFNYDWSIINIKQPIIYPILQPYSPPTPLPFQLPTIICYDSNKSITTAIGYNKEVT